MTHFTAWSMLVLFAYVWEIAKTADFLEEEADEFYEVKVGTYSQINVYMTIYDYPRSRSFTDLCPRSLRFNIFKLFPSETARPIEAKFHMEPPWDVWNENMFKCSR